MPLPLAWTLETGAGAWNAPAWLIAFLVAALLAVWFRRRGRADYRPGTGQAKPFISGNDEPPAGRGHIPASNMYWGFLESLRGYYRRLAPLHSGEPVDYVLWFVGVAALMFIVGWLA